MRRAARAGEAHSVEGMLRDLSELKVGDPVVHEQHGIGRYQGSVSLDLGEGEAEFLLLEYEGGDKLYVPVAQLRLIGRYTGAQPEEAPLHKLGSGQWEKAKRKAAEAGARHRRRAARTCTRSARRARATRSLRSTAGLRGVRRGLRLRGDARPGRRDPRRDPRHGVAGKPMDRLVCGDVGFGKTEVALRAAFVAVADGKQVAVLCPTTLLAEQHFQTFRDRFAEWPVKIAELSRFRTAKEQTAALKGLAEGQDRHRHRHAQAAVARREVQAPGPGDHRRGAPLRRAPEGALKALRAEVDVLTLTATPIPRTLAMSLEGLRDFSVIATAPQRRLAIKTFVTPWSEGLIREAVLRELKRGGQVYFLHNEVETIESMRERLRALLPEARIAVAHGQMRERELERVMRDFYQQRFNVLLCSTIIETGIDVPTPTPSSSTAPTSSAWRSCTSCAAASAARTTRPTPTC